MKTVNVYGAGLAGLTIAHELVEKGFQVRVFEKDSSAGGMAKSKRNTQGMPTEHSWRGYGPFYHNTFDILKRIPNTIERGNEKVFTLQQIEQSERLLTYLGNTVYDLTDFAKQHPGGKLIYLAKGNDLKKTWRNVGMSWHLNNNSVKKILNTYKIGTLVISTVYNNLSKESIDFELLKNGMGSNDIKIDLKDIPYLTYIYAKVILANKRKEVFSKERYLGYLQNKVSQRTYDYLVHFLSGPGYGFDINTISMFHHGWFIQQQLGASNSGWKTMTSPTNEAWIDSWVNFLKQSGVQFYFNYELRALNKSNNDNNNNVISFAILENNNKFFQSNADEHCLCINPNNLINLGLGLVSPNLQTINNQIGFHIQFKKKIKLPKKNIAFVIIDSAYNITFYPQDYHFDKTVKLNKNGDTGEIISHWSGTCIMPYNQGALYKKSALELSRQELMNEILYQLLNSKHLKKIVLDNNPGMQFDLSLVANAEIYDEWKTNNLTKLLEANNKKWVNNIFNEKDRPDQKTSIKNLYIGGAHTKTTINIWSMESAVESGKIVANHILEKYKLPSSIIHSHNSNIIIKLFQFLDDILYTLGLPSIVDIKLFILFLFVIKVIVNKYYK
jgi:cytochrome b involved in lipid metabolism